MWCGAVRCDFHLSESYGAVRRGTHFVFSKIARCARVRFFLSFAATTVRCGAVYPLNRSYGAIERAPSKIRGLSRCTTPQSHHVQKDDGSGQPRLRTSCTKISRLGTAPPSLRADGTSCQNPKDAIYNHVCTPGGLRRRTRGDLPLVLNLRNPPVLNKLLKFVTVQRVTAVVWARCTVRYWGVPGNLGIKKPGTQERHPRGARKPAGCTEEAGRCHMLPGRPTAARESRQRQGACFGGAITLCDEVQR